MTDAAAPDRLDGLFANYPAAWDMKGRLEWLLRPHPEHSTGSSTWVEAAVVFLDILSRPQDPPPTEE